MLTVSSSWILSYIEVVQAGSGNGMMEAPIPAVGPMTDWESWLEGEVPSFSGDEDAEITEPEDATEVVICNCSCNCLIWFWAAPTSSSRVFFINLKHHFVFHREQYEASSYDTAFTSLHCIYDFIKIRMEVKKWAMILSTKYTWLIKTYCDCKLMLPQPFFPFLREFDG